MRSASLTKLFEHLQQAILAVLTIVIAIVAALSTWHLVLLLIQLLREGNLDPLNHEVLQAIFGAIFSVLIALEFRPLLMTTKDERLGAFQVRSVVLIAMLATVRRFIVLDLNTAAVGETLAVVAAILVLGVVYWLIRAQDRTLNGSTRHLPAEDE